MVERSGALEDLVTGHPCVVIGATGRIGAALCAELRTRHHAVLPVTSTSSWPAPDDRIAVVVNAAGVGLNSDASPNGDVLAHVNVALAERAAEIAVASGARLVHFGSVVSRSRRLDGYARTKSMASDTLWARAGYGDLALVELRPHIVCGGTPRSPNLLERICASLLSGSAFDLRHPTARRDLVHIDDLVAATIAAIELPTLPDGALELGVGEDRTLYQLADAIASLLGMEGAAWARAEGPSGESEVPDDLVADPAVLRALIGRAPFLSQACLDATVEVVRRTEVVR